MTWSTPNHLRRLGGSSGSSPGGPSTPTTTGLFASPLVAEDFSLMFDEDGNVMMAYYTCAAPINTGGVAGTLNACGG